MHVYSDSVFCSKDSEANGKWTSQIEDFQQSNEYVEGSGIDGEPIEFEWNIFSGSTTIEILREILNDLSVRQQIQNNCRGTLPLMSMFNETKNGNSLHFF